MSKTMSSESDKKVVQTELPRVEYERLVRIAEAEDQSLKETLRRAVAEFADHRSRHDPDDPFFADPPETDGEEGLTATDTDSHLYEQ